jgi:AraC-like DNA-binding protein
MVNTLSILRDFYNPKQPTVQKSDTSIVYYELSPVKELQHVIYCYWELKTKEKLTESYLYNVVADGCIDIFFEVNKAQESYVMGFCRKHTTFNLGQEFHYIGIRFLPTMFSQMFKFNVSLIRNRYDKLFSISPLISEFIAKHFDANTTLPKAKSLFDKYFSSQIKTTTFNWDERLYGAISIILNKKGYIEIEKGLNIGISTRQLRRLFEFTIGDTVKSFCQVVRFQYILTASENIDVFKQEKIYLDAGYFDQAHFIKDFKRFYGVTPSKAFGK